LPAETLDRAAAVLAQGGALVWFPEAWRSPNGRLQAFRPGIGLLLDRAPVTVVPAGIRGTFEALPRGRRLPRRHSFTVRFGPPLTAAEIAAGGDAQATAERLRARVAALVEP